MIHMIVPRVGSNCLISHALGRERGLGTPAFIFHNQNMAIERSLISKSNRSLEQHPTGRHTTNFFHILPKSTANFPSIITVRSVTPSAMNWEARACPCLCLQLERASGHAVSKDPNPTTSLPRGPPILDERRTNSWPLNVPTCSHNLPIDPEARPLSTLPYYQLIWILKVYTAGVYSPSQFITRAINEGAGMPYPENHIADIHDDDSTAACLSDSESMYETMSPGFTTVCGLTIYPSPLI